MSRNFNCPATGSPCVDRRCLNERCFELERIKVEEAQELAAKKKQEYLNDCWLDPEVREQERQRRLQEEIAEIERRTQRRNSN
jgi:hypothetical protein